VAPRETESQSQPYSHAAGGVLGDTGKVGEDVALPGGWRALGGCLFKPGGELVTGRSPESLAGIATALLGQNAAS
jgi:hypothetical protein